jgi:hypothetical protein
VRRVIGEGNKLDREKEVERHNTARACCDFERFRSESHDHRNRYRHPRDNILGGSQLPTFRVTYRREKPAGAVQFDPTIEFVDYIDLNVETAEEATLQYDNQRPYVKIQRVEKIPTGVLLGTQNVSTSGVTSTWIGLPQASTNVSRVGGTIDAFFYDSNATRATVDLFRDLGVDESTLEICPVCLRDPDN